MTKKVKVILPKKQFKIKRVGIYARVSTREKEKCQKEREELQEKVEHLNLIMKENLTLQEKQEIIKAADGDITKVSMSYKRMKAFSEHNEIKK